MTTAAAWLSGPPSSGSSMWAIVGSPGAPMPSEAAVMPTWIVETDSLMSSIWWTASAAPLRPCAASCSSFALRARTSAYSAMTKNAFSASRSAVRGRRGARGGGAGGGRRGAPATRPPAATSGRVVVHRDGDRGKPTRRRGASPERVDALRHVEVALGQAALAVRRQRQPDLVPPVDEDVRVVVGRLGRLGDLVDVGHRRREVLELAVADDRAAVAAPVGARRAALDLLIGQEVCHTLSSRAHRLPRAPRDRAALRARPRRPGRRRDARVRPSYGGPAAQACHARRAAA